MPWNTKPMKLIFAKEFEKRYRNLTKNQQLRVDKTLITFARSPSLASLRHHALKGDWAGHYSISAGGDLRIHLKYLEGEAALIVTLGTHSQLYGW